MKKKHEFTSAKDLLFKNDLLYEKKRAAKYVTREFQDFGYRLAVQLDDLAHKSLYIKLSKTTKRAILEQALSYTLDYPKAKNKARIFMWKMKQIKIDMKNKKEESKDENLRLL